MIWAALFCLYTGYILVTAPWKARRYWLGLDVSPMAVKVEECLSVGFHLVGCLALYNLAFDTQWLTPRFWSAWLTFGVLWTLSPLVIKSPKLEYLKSIASSRAKLVCAISLGCAVLLPLYLGVYFQSGFYLN